MDNTSTTWTKQHDLAEQYVRDFYAKVGVWPPIKAIVTNAHVGTGTAWRALKRAKQSTESPQ